MKRICVITSTRADYGLLYWLMKGLSEDKDFELQIIATGTHLSPSFGNTYKTIEKNGFNITKKINIKASGKNRNAVAKTMALTIKKMTDAFQQLQPDLIVLLGDRYEIFATAQAAMISNIPIAHLHGGELTEGAMDDSMRHAITKLSHLHFTSAETYRKRVIQLGESPSTVFNVGATGIDNINKLKLLTPQELSTQLNLKIEDNTFLVTYHPETLSPSTIFEQMEPLFNALSLYTDTTIIFTKSNADLDGLAANALIDNFVAKTPNAHVFTSLGQLRYLSAVKSSKLVIGNSSSGIIEVPYLDTPTVNIGNRQKGRLYGSSVFSATTNKESITNAINLALAWQPKDDNQHLLYGNGNTADKIIQTLKNVLLQSINEKEFNDL